MNNLYNNIDVTLGHPGGSRDGNQTGGLVNPAPSRPWVGSINSNTMHNMTPMEGGSDWQSQEPPIDRQETPITHEQLGTPGAAHESNDQDNPRHRNKQINKNKVTIASLNIRGRRIREGYNKYRTVTRWMRMNRIAVLAIQETKLDELDVAIILKENPSFSLLQNNLDTRSAGVGFLINKELTKRWKLNTETLIQGRALKLTIKSEKCNISLINVYSPNTEIEKIDFFDKLHDLIDPTQNLPLILLGDFNFVEDSIDRIPMHNDDQKITESFDKLKNKLNLIDAWRSQNELLKMFTYTHSSYGSMARIDRVYTNRNVSKKLSNWSSDPLGDLSDHSVIKCDLEIKTEVYQGRGLWRLPMEVLDEPQFAKKAAKILKDVEMKMKANRNAPRQPMWNKTKGLIKKLATLTQKNIRKEKKERMKTLNKQLVNLSNLIDENNDRQILPELKEIDQKRRKANAKRIENHYIKSKARHMKESERSSHYWYKLGKQNNEPTTIHALYDPQGALKTKTKDIANIAKTFYQNLLDAPKRDNDFNEKTDEFLSAVGTSLSPSQQNDVSKIFDETEVCQAIRQSDNGKSPGVDGITFEFYKLWLNLKNKDKPDICYILSEIYNEIEEYGTVKDSNFNKGAMSILYKKGERERIENYRPLTLSNTDYKIMTKIIATRLGKIADSIIHPNQTGFIPKRGLFDNTRLSQSVITYTDIKKENGCILALDQEKAYDRIAHDYLWKVLKKFKFPEKFIRLIKILYKDATTCVLINGVIAGTIKLRKGVKQGCPMSCLLYDIGIEPLGCAIRMSQLTGIRIKEIPDKILVSMFADDTLIYLTINDDICILFLILDKFCYVSNAKFNEKKYEALPLGDPEFRKKLTETRKLNDLPGNVLRNEIRIIKEGEPMRTLGAWIGHNIDISPNWNNIVEKQKEIMNKWSTMNISLKGKELILKSLIASRAFFLATVNGIPNHIIDQIHKNMRHFVWDGKKGSLNWKEAVMPREKGGLALPDLYVHKDCITISWIKRWLTKHKNRPTWAYIVDEIIFENVAKDPHIDDLSKISWILQSWHEKTLANSTIPTFIKEMLSTARKYNIGIDAPKLSLGTKKALPIWSHIGAKNKYKENKKSAKCLRNNHGLKTVEDVNDFIRYPTNPPTCTNPQYCQKMAAGLLDSLLPKFNTSNMTPHQDNLDHSPQRKKQYRSLNFAETPVMFNPDVTARGDPLKHIRILGNTIRYKKRQSKDSKLKTNPAYRLPEIPPTDPVTIYTKGMTTTNNNGDTMSVIGLWSESEQFAPQYIRLTDKTDGYRAELIAIMKATQAPFELIIKSESKRAVETILRKTEENEDNDWLNTPNSDVLKEIVNYLRSKAAKSSFQWTKMEENGNKEARLLAEKATLLNESSEINISQDHPFNVEGARLSKLTQRITYDLIMRKRLQALGKIETVGTNPTKINLNKIQEAYYTTCKVRLSHEKIWLDIPKIYPKRLQDFIWKSIHGRLKCGKYFLNIPTLSHRAYCECGAIESDEHIMIECQRNNSPQVWQKIKQLWEKIVGTPWPGNTIHLIRGIASAKLKGTNETHSKALSHLYKTLITQTTWTIWKSRNLRIFQDQTRSLDSIKTILEKEINELFIIERECCKTRHWTERKALLNQNDAKWDSLNLLHEDVKGQKTIMRLTF